MKIFLAPRSNETSYKNFLSTIESGVDYTLIEPHLTNEGKKVLGGRGKLFAWGTKLTKKSSWGKMQEGDLVLFYRKGIFVYAGTVIYKQQGEGLGLSLWPPKPGEKPWPCVFFLDDLKQIDIPIKDIANLAGYQDNFVVQGFMPLNNEGTRAILDKFGTSEKFLNHYAQSNREIGSDIEEEEEKNEISAHADAQMLLLKIGRMLGYDTFSPDKSKEAYGEKLQDYITITDLPKRYIGEEIFPLVKQIDVIWFKEDVPICAFEVEHSTKFGNGFQRLYQLHALSSKLFIISAQKNKPLFDKFIETDPYYRKKKSFKFKNYKQLEEYFRAVSEFEAINSTFLNK